MTGQGVSSRSSHSWAAGRTTFSAKPWTQSRISFWSSLNSSEKFAAPASDSSPAAAAASSTVVASITPSSSMIASIDGTSLEAIGYPVGADISHRTMAATNGVIKDQGVRAPVPPFENEHGELRDTIGRWVREEIAPHVDEWEAAREFPLELYRRAGELGFLGLKYPVELGGQGGDSVHDAVWAEELAAAGASGGVGAGLGAHTGIATPPVFRFGTPEQHERFLRPAIRGERIGALGITEPGAGSDVASIRTQARKVDGGYVLKCRKQLKTKGVRAAPLVCAAKTPDEG